MYINGNHDTVLGGRLTYLLDPEARIVRSLS